MRDDGSTREVPLREHYSFETAFREFVRACNVYYRQCGHALWTRLPGNIIIWSTYDFDFTFKREKATPTRIHAMAIKSLQHRLLRDIKHSISCHTRLDDPCNCARGELRKLVHSLTTPHQEPTGRRIRRNLCS